MDSKKAQDIENKFSEYYNACIIQRTVGKNNKLIEGNYYLSNNRIDKEYCSVFNLTKDEIDIVSTIFSKIIKNLSKVDYLKTELIERSTKMGFDKNSDEIYLIIEYRD